MSTTRAFKPIFGPSGRVLLHQLLSQSTGRCTSGKLISRRLPAPICSSCRQNFTLRLTQQQSRFSSSNSTPPKPPGGNDNDDVFRREPPPSPFDFAPPGEPHPQQPHSEPNPSFQQQQQQQQQSPLPPPPPPPEEDKKPQNPDLPSAQNSRRSTLNRHFSAFMDRAQTTLFAASQRINDLTGYSGIETLKSQISELETRLARAQSTLHAARSSYKHAVSSRSATQREVTTLLARQKTWTPADFERFTALYRQDYELEASVARRAAELEDAERDAERLGRELGAAILSRYHEEQIWSDKIRRMSTWGTWGLMSVNVLLFLVFQFGAEPWRRQRLVRGFEQKVREALEEERRRGEAFRERWEREAERRQIEALAAATAPVEIPIGAEALGEEQLETTEVEMEEPVFRETVLEEGFPPRIPWREWKETFSNPEWWKAYYAELSSDRKVAMRMRDASILALEGAAAGAAFVGTIAAILLLRRS
ncbi:hypothetical protein M426DRAFT_321842 [Hypoxylon sp. CI-4A]|nr:hypothetical protein M426DRAFT_321842 [Hypoxylon sp. CI-4A]